MRLNFDFEIIDGELQTSNKHIEYLSTFKVDDSRYMFFKVDTSDRCVSFDTIVNTFKKNERSARLIKVFRAIEFKSCHEKP